MANPRIQSLVADLEKFITTVNKASADAVTAAANIQRAFENIKLDQFTSNLSKVATDFNLVATNSTASTSELQKARRAMDELAQSYQRFNDVVKATPAARPGIYEAARPMIASKQPAATYQGLGSVATQMYPGLAGTAAEQDLNDLLRQVTRGKGASAPKSQELAKRIIESETNVSNQILRDFATEVDATLIALGKQSKFTPGRLGQIVQQKAQVQSFGQEAATPAQYVTQQFNPGAVEKINSVLAKYKLTLEGVKAVHRDLSTGITRLDFSRIGATAADGTQAIEKFNLTLDKNGNILEDTQKRYRTFGDAILRDIKEVAKWTIAIAVVYGPIRKLGELIQQMIENQSKLADVQIATNSTTQQLGETFDRLALVASRTGETISGTIDAYKLAFQAAGNIAEPHIRAATATKLLSDALTLSKLSGMEHAQAMDVLSGALKQVGLNLDQGTVLLDKWVAVSKSANVNIATLAQSFAITSTAAENVGINVDKLNGIIAAVSEVTNKSAEETGNMVRAFISGFQTDNARQELNRYGVSVLDADGKLRDFMDVMTELRSLMDAGVIREDEAAKLAEVLGGGARRGAQYAAFFQNLQRVDQVARVSAMASGDAYAALGIKINTVQTESTKLANAFTVLAQAMGSEGGMLDNASALLKIFTGMVNTLSELTKLLGRSAPLLATLSIGGLYMARNPGAKAGLGQGVANLAYNPLLAIMTQFYKMRGLPEDQTGGVGYRPSNYFVQNREKEMERLTEELRQKVATTGPESELQSRGIVTLQNARAYGDQAAATFSQKLERNIGGVFAIGAATLSVSMHAMAGEWGEAAATAVGATLGGALGVAAFGSLNPVMIILGQALGEAFYNTFVKYTPDLGTAIADAMAATLGEKTPEQIKQSTVETLSNSMFEAIGRNAPGSWAQQRQNRMIPPTTEDFTKQGQVAVGSTFEIAGLFRRGPSDAFEKLIQRWVKGTIPTEQALQKAVETALTDRDLTQDQYAILKALSGEYGDAAKEAARKLLDEMRSQALGGLGGQYGKMTTPVTQRQGIYVQQFQAQGLEFQKQQGNEALRKLSFGEIGLREYTSQKEALEKINLAVTALYSNLQSLDGTKNMFDQMDDSVNGAAESYEKLANLIVNVSPEEIEEIGKLSQGLDDLYTKFKKSGTGAEEYAQKQAELIQLLQTMASGQFTKQFQAPSIFELPEGTTQAALQELIQGAQALQDQYLKTFVPDEATRAKIIAEYGKLAVLIGSVFSGSIQGVGSEFLNKFLQTMQDAGKISAGKGPQFQIRQLDVTGSQLAGLQQRMDYWTKWIQQKFPDYKLQPQDIGAISTDKQTRVLHGDNLVLQLAMQELIDVGKKQLDGIYNLPTDASFFVPFQGYKLGFTQGGAGISAGDLKSSAEDGTKAGAREGVKEGLGYLREFTSPFLKQGTVPPKTRAEARETTSPILRYETYGPNREQMIEEFLKRMGTAVPTRPPERAFPQKDELTPPDVPSKLESSIQSLIDSINRWLMRGGLGGVPGEKFPEVPTGQSIPKSISKTDIPKLDTRLSLNVNSNIQLMVDGRMLAAIIKQYLYEDLIRSEGIGGSITRTIVV